jgi:hypothetical protein
VHASHYIRKCSALLFRAERASRFNAEQEAAKKQAEEELRKRSEKQAAHTAAQ